MPNRLKTSLGPRRMAFGYEPPQLVMLFLPECERGMGVGACGVGTKLTSQCNPGGLASGMGKCSTGCIGGMFGCGTGTQPAGGYFTQCCEGDYVSGDGNCANGPSGAKSCITGDVAESCNTGVCLTTGKCS